MFKSKIERKIIQLDNLTDKIVKKCLDCDCFPCEIVIETIEHCIDLTFEIEKEYELISEPETIKKGKRVNIVWQN